MNFVPATAEITLWLCNAVAVIASVFTRIDRELTERVIFSELEVSQI